MAVMVSVGRAYGALGSAADVVAPTVGLDVYIALGVRGTVDGVPSDNLLERGTEPVRRTVKMPTVSSVRPSDREK